jgi:cell division protein DivIC
MAKRRSRRRMSKGNRLGMVLIAIMVIILLIVLLVQSQELSRQNEAYLAEKAELEQQIKDEEIRAEEIEKLEEYVDSTEYIEKIAREKLGLVYEDEVIYVPEE